MTEDEKKCPECGITVEPCDAPIPELGDWQVCGDWGCALAAHLLKDCPSERGQAYRARVAARKARNEKEGE